MDDLLLVGIACAFLAGGTVKGISGLGLPTVSLALLSLLVAPSAAAPLLIAPVLATNLVQCIGPHLHRLWRPLGPMWLGIPLGALTTPFARLSEGGEELRTALGAVLLAYAAYGLLRPTLKLRAQGGRLAAVSFATGYATGVLTAATGIFVIPMILFLQALDLDKDETIQALGLSFTVCTLALGATVGWSASLRAGLSMPGAVALAAAFAGVWVGTRLRHRIPMDGFRTLLFLMFGVLGMTMVAR